MLLQIIKNELVRLQQEQEKGLADVEALKKEAISLQEMLLRINGGIVTLTKILNTPLDENDI